jgi:NTP pyrophosphatase (non-canonical NTP hydrolase)
VNNILTSIVRERERQDALWGKPNDRNYTHEQWLMVLVEEVGEVAKSIQDGEVENLKEELTQVAAVAIAFLETLPTDLKENEVAKLQEYFERMWGINLDEARIKQYIKKAEREE